MTIKKFIPAAMAAVIVFGVTSGAAFAWSGDNDIGCGISTILKAKTSISEAITAAERKSGGRAMSATIKDDNGTYLYRIKTVLNDRVDRVFVDPASGKVVRTEQEGLVSRAFDWWNEDEFARLVASPTTLTTAIATAEQATGGKAVQAAFENEDSNMQFKVEVAGNKRLRNVRIDSATGKIATVTFARTGEHRED